MFLSLTSPYDFRNLAWLQGNKVVASFQRFYFLGGGGNSHKKHLVHLQVWPKVLRLMAHGCMSVPRMLRDISDPFFLATFGVY